MEISKAKRAKEILECISILKSNQLKLNKEGAIQIKVNIDYDHGIPFAGEESVVQSDMTKMQAECKAIVSQQIAKRLKVLETELNNL